MAISTYPKKVTWLQRSIPTWGSRNLSFAFLSRKGEQVASFTTCRDFLHDMVFMQANRWESCACAWHRIDSPTISLSQARILVVENHASDFCDRLERSLGFVHKVEQFLGIKVPARVYRVEGGACKDCCLFIGSSPWMLAPPMLSLFTLAIRVGFGANLDKSPMEVFTDIGNGGGSYTNLDSYPCKVGKYGLQRLHDEGYKNIFYTDPRANYPNSAKGGTQTHSSFGIASFAKGIPRHYIPFWYPPDWKCPPEFAMM